MPSFSSLDVVVADRGWILEAIARRIKENAPPNTTVHIIDKVEQSTSQVKLFMPYSAYSASDGFDVGFFTHREDIEPAKSRFIEIAQKCDLCLCMSEKYAKLLRENGVSNAVSVGFAVDLDGFFPILRVGVVGRAYSHTKRKGEDLIADLELPAGIKLVFSGEGWPRPSQRVTDSGMAEFYSTLDYLLVPSRIEGGPAPLLESLACGVPVIAPSDIGFVSEFPHVSYTAGSKKSIEDTLVRLYDEKCQQRTSVKDMGWEHFAARLFSAIDEAHRRFPNAVSAAPDKADVVISSHGSEETSRGGPTTRIKLIEKFSASEELGISVAHNLSEHPRGKMPALVHLFNSWPLQTAERELLSLRRHRAFSLFSPIALNLECLPTYSISVPRILNEDVDVEERLLKLKWLCPSADEYLNQEGLLPAEGVRGHFESLRRTTALADHLVLLSEYERSFLTRIGCDLDGRSTIIPNGVDAHHFIGASPTKFHDRYDLKHFVLCTGRIERRKNQALLARAVAAIPDLKLVLIGAVADEDYFRLVRSQIDGRRLVHIGRIEDRELLASAYAACDVFANCAFAEGASLASIEAFHAGARLVLSNQSSEREYFGSQAFYAHPLDVDGMRESILKALEQDRLPATGAEYLQRGVDSGKSHVSLSEQAYERCLVQRSSDTDPTVKTLCLDVTHWAHSESNGVHPTGVTRLEEKAFASGGIGGDSFVSYVVWNSPSGRFIDVTAEDVRAGRHVEYANARIDDARKPVETPEKTTQETPISSAVSDDVFSRFGQAYRAYFRDREQHSRRQLIGLIRKQSGIGAAAIYTAKISIAELMRLCGVSPGSESPRQPEPVPAPVNTQPKASTACVGSKLHLAANTMLVIGQPWISNDRYIDSLEKLLCVEQLDLSFYVHDLTFVTHPRSHPYAAKVTYRRRLQKMMSLASQIYVNGDSVSLDLRRYCSGLKLSKSIDVLPYAAFSSGFKGLQHGSLSDPSDGPSTALEPMILMVATLNERKGHAFLLDVWDYLLECKVVSGFSLCIVGKPMGATALAQRVSSAEQVTFIEKADDQLLRTLYKTCAFTVFPSESEGWGLPIEESIEFGKLCLASDRCPAALDARLDLVELIAPDDFFGWADRIKYHISKFHEGAAVAES